MADFKLISYEKQGETLRIAINRPPNNVLDIATMEEINLALDTAMEDATAKVLVISGNGDKAFSTGVDVVDHTPDKMVKMIDVFHGILKRLMMVPIPTVAEINGSALGGACDMAVASESAKLGQPEIKLGVFPPIAAILLPRQIPMTKVMELLLGGGIIDAAEGHRVGLVNAVFPKESFGADTEKFLEDYKQQIAQMRKMGGLAGLVDKLPAELKAAAANAQVDEKQVGRLEGIINSMTPAERAKPELLKASRKRRIAAGAGVPVQEVNRLLAQFEQAQKMMKMVAKGGLQKMMRGMRGLMPGR